MLSEAKAHKNRNSFEIKLERIHIGERLKKFREEKEIKLDEMKDQINVSVTTLSNYENGIYNIPIGNFIRMCKLLDINIYDFEDIINENESCKKV